MKGKGKEKGKAVLRPDDDGAISEAKLDGFVDALLGSETEEERNLPEPTEEETNAILDKMFPGGWKLDEIHKQLGMVGDKEWWNDKKWDKYK